MADLADIPLRDAKDGAAQLVLLRSYLKDPSGDTYPDNLLIDLLVNEDSLIIWTELVGDDSGVLPYSYDTSYLKEPINRVRLLTSDTNELSIKHTNMEILAYLDVIPLRYVVMCINMETSTDITTPTDPNHPIAILRNYLKDGDGKDATDDILVKLILSSGMNPFGIVLDKLERITSTQLAETSSNMGSNMASIDGITFSSPLEETATIQQSFDSVSAHLARSTYIKDSVFGMYECGVNLSEQDWEKKWYAI
ncbi:hypothetical protein COPG_00065 [Colwellia phage 9A]|uniref:Uncharacterized protein n=1 Tax=Colwellia phage 9A TaxID=765765 RepID=I3UME6_9CAUD|nr:hypothetical protein COPG_00065 [Colwellia phage 9A]AFK66661.1 hypothetical protein COPG_00065 [Colwellia phage 9A]